MFSRQITPSLRLSLSIPSYAEELYALTDSNRPFLRKWLPWLDAVRSAADTRAFIVQQLHLFADGKALHATLFKDERIAGVVGFNQIDSVNACGHVGYWLGEAFNGQGIMSQAVRELIALGKDELNLRRIEIRCAVENHRSRAIPQRLGFSEEGTLLRVEKVNERFLDHVVYGLLL